MAFESATMSPLSTWMDLPVAVQGSEGDIVAGSGWRDSTIDFV